VIPAATAASGGGGQGIIGMFGESVNPAAVTFLAKKEPSQGNRQEPILIADFVSKMQLRNRN
jgi:hypothetical protein